MNKIHTPGSNPQDEVIDQKEIITESTWASIEQSLSETPLTTDEKINQLADQVSNINNGLIQLIELSKILIKWQIENWNMMTEFVQSMWNFTQSTDAKLTEIESYLNTKITNAVKEIVDIQQQSNKKNLRNQKILAQWLSKLAYKTIPTHYSKSDCIDLFNSVEQ